jgi:two-component system, OmpR family, response regulator
VDGARAASCSGSGQVAPRILLAVSAMTIATTAGIGVGDDVLRERIARVLTQAGYVARPAATGALALAAFTDQPPGVLVLDADLTADEGQDLRQTLRARGVLAPALLLVPAGAPRIAGAEDQLAKPFPLAALLVRVGALAHPLHGAASAAGFGLAAGALVAGERRVDLTPTEHRLLAALLARRGEVVPRGALLAAGWPGTASPSDNALDAYVARVRRKLRAAGAPDVLRTRRGIGYELAVGVARNGDGRSVAVQAPVRDAPP